MRITEEQKKQGQKLYNTLIQKSWENNDFKEQLISTPNEVISQVLGKSYPSKSKIVVEDQTDRNIIYLNIPKKIDVEDIELTDEQLETVSGGEVFLGVLIGVEVAIILVGAGYTFAEYYDKQN